MTKRNNPYQKLSAEELDELIECYFDCSLSEEDEMSLRKVLAATRHDSAAIREAKAVMGYTAVAKTMRPATNKPLERRRIWLRTAAAVAAIVVLIAGVHYYPVIEDTESDTGICVAYVNGQRIDNKEAIMRQMELDLLTMQTGSETVANRIDTDFSALRDAIDKLN